METKHACQWICLPMGSIALICMYTPYARLTSLDLGAIVYRCLELDYLPTEGGPPVAMKPICALGICITDVISSATCRLVILHNGHLNSTHCLSRNQGADNENVSPCSGCHRQQRDPGRLVVACRSSRMCMGVHGPCAPRGTLCHSRQVVGR